MAHPTAEIIPFAANETFGFMPAMPRHLSQAKPPDRIRLRKKNGPYGPKKYSTLKSSFTASSPDNLAQRWMKKASSTLR